MESYLIACHKCTKHAIETVVVKLIRGEIKDAPKSWAPSSAELSTAIREEMEAVKRQVELAAERVAIEDNRPVAIRPKLIEERIADAKARMAREGRRFLFDCDSHSAMISRMRSAPSGSVYIGILCAAYGTVGSINQPDLVKVSDEELQEILRADMFEPDPAPPTEPPKEHTDVEF